MLANLQHSNSSSSRMALETVESNGVNGDEPNGHEDDLAPPCKMAKTRSKGVLDALLTSKKPVAGAQQQQAEASAKADEEEEEEEDEDGLEMDEEMADETVVVVKPEQEDDEEEDDEEKRTSGSLSLGMEQEAVINGDCAPSRSVSGKGSAASAPPSAGYFTCAHCNKFFWSEASLKHHSSLYHSEKSFVCEICGKAFRFRSNLAEHRSVHTSLKPYVCRFCGKSSRLKGNLTKHILKHHKREQNAFIGKDDIIIKKGKKSVKDPAAVDFLEKSMIILTSEQAALNTSPPSANSSDQLTKANRYFGVIKESASDAGDSRSNGGSNFLDAADHLDLSPRSSKDLSAAQTTVRSRRPVASANSNDGADAKKSTGAPFTPVSGIAAGAFPYMVFDQSAAAKGGEDGLLIGKGGRANGKLLSLSQQASQQNHVGGTRCQICQKHFRKAANLALHLTVKHRFPPPKEPDTCTTPSNSVARLNDLLQFAGDSEPLDLKRRLFRDAPPSVTSSSTIALEKLSGIAAAAAAAAAASSPMFGGAPETPAAAMSLSLDMKEVKTSLAHLKQAANESAKADSVVRSLEARIAHIERQVETTASTLFAVFHMQTEMHNAFCNFRGDMVEQLKTLLRYMRDQS